jgi:hypothetical protein
MVNAVDVVDVGFAVVAMVLAVLGIYMLCSCSSSSSSSSPSCTSYSEESYKDNCCDRVKNGECYVQVPTTLDVALLNGEQFFKMDSGTHACKAKECYREKVKVNPDMRYSFTNMMNCICSNAWDKDKCYRTPTISRMELEYGG